MAITHQDILKVICTHFTLKLYILDFIHPHKNIDLGGYLFSVRLVGKGVMKIRPAIWGGGKIKFDQHF